MTYERDWTHDEPPRKLWLQWCDENGNISHPEDRTWSRYREYPTDLCFIRSGKTDILRVELDAAHARIAELEREVSALKGESTATTIIEEPTP